MVKTYELVRMAYKKFKANLYFDKTQLPLRDKLVLFEDKGIEEQLDALHDALTNEDNQKWENFAQQLLDKIGVLLYPKSLKKIPSDTVIFNTDNMPIEMDKPQYFIDLPIEGHILGVLWILSVGLTLDKIGGNSGSNSMYEHSYGNRLSKMLLGKQQHDITYSPNLFEPYFSQYEKWRDHGLDKARAQLANQQDALILTLDFKSFYYSVHLDEVDFEEFLSRLQTCEEWHKRVNSFVFKVILGYSNALRKLIATESELQIGERNVLPIGFLPSNILGNWILTEFDNAIIEKWNPVYYGRYVDDIIIVDKVEKNSSFYEKARKRRLKERLTSDMVIQNMLVCRKILATSTDDDNGVASEKESGKEGTVYHIDSNALRYKHCNITVQSKKVRLFYFQSGATQALLDCFKSNITQGVSEFRLLPDMSSVLSHSHRNYSEFFDLHNEEGINKFRGITGIELDKFALSKFLGKCRKVGGLIQGSKEDEFDEDIMLILDARTLISNYGAWERLFEIFILSNRSDLYARLALRIVDAIERFVVPDGICNAKTIAHNSLLRVFLSAVHRTSALVWDTDMRDALQEISKRVQKLSANEMYSLNPLSSDDISIIRLAYCKTRMVNKYMLPLPIDCLLKNLGKNAANLCCFDKAFEVMDTTWVDKAQRGEKMYYPYIVSPQEISFVLMCTDLLSGVKSIDPKTQDDLVNKLFVGLNYMQTGNKRQNHFRLKTIRTEPMEKLSEKTQERTLYVSTVNSDPKQEKGQLAIAIGNAKLTIADVVAVLDGKPNRSYERYQQLATMINEAISQRADMLVLPECFLPFEWVPSIAQVCANNQLALITGIEYVIVPREKSRGQVYNLTAVILPYECDNEHGEHGKRKFAHVSYHNKVAYSPAERHEITGRRYEFTEGRAYQLYSWHNAWFPVYCCFELASIRDRVIFQEYADLIVAVELNPDVSYYSNIVESWSRDLHCYCVQVNSSVYGDSRIVAPKKSVEKNVIQAKGGRNSCVLVDTIDIEALRDFQMLEYSLQLDCKTFKPSPPGIEPDRIIQAKRQNALDLSSL